MHAEKMNHEPTDTCKLCVTMAHFCESSVSQLSQTLSCNN